MGFFDFIEKLGDEINPTMSYDEKQAREKERQDKRRQWEEEEKDLYYARSAVNETDYSQDDDEHVYRSRPTSGRRKRGCRPNCCFIIAIIGGLPFCMYLISPLMAPVVDFLIKLLTQLGFYNLF